MHPQISIIVPIYNVEHLLKRCLNSIVEQSFINWECLLINDGSADGSGTICDEYARTDRRFRVFHKSNGGVSSARNVGLDNALGEYICFCDSDDWVGKEWLENLYKYRDYDIVIGGFTSHYHNSDGAIQKLTMKHECGYLPQDTKSLFDVLYNSLNLGYLWCRLFRKDLINNNKIRFNLHHKLREDEEFISFYLKYCKSFCVVEYNDYQYSVPNFNKKYNEMDTEALFECNKSVIDNMKTIYGSYNHNIFYLYAQHAIFIIRQRSVKKYSVKEMLDWLVPFYYKIHCDNTVKTPNCIRINLLRGRFTNILNYYVYGFLLGKKII